MFRNVLAAACLGLGHPAFAMPDMTGHDVRLDGPPRRIADLWFAHNGLMVMLGAASRIVVTVDRPQDQPWMFAVAPALGRAQWMPAQTPDVEAMVHRNVQLVIIPRGEVLRQQMQAANLPTAAMLFTTEEGLLRATDLTAALLQDDAAKATAASYRKFVGAVTHHVTSRLGSVAGNGRPRVLHLQSLLPLRVDGADTIIDRWIELAGGHNAAASVSGSKRPVTFEQIMAWDPDVLILPGDAPDLSSLPQHAEWSALRAVADGQVYRNPKGVFPWDRYGPEFPLQVEWTAKILHPAIFRDVDMPSETIAFYRRFYHTTIDRTDAQAILRAEPPPTGRVYHE